MTTATQGTGGSWFSKLLILLLLAAAVALYLLALRQGVVYQESPTEQASIRVIEGAAPVSAPVRQEPLPAAPVAPPVRDLPDDQMALIRRVFAPETLTQ